MKFSEEQVVADLRPFIVDRLEDISDADSSVLADYVLALLRSDAPDETVKTDTINNLQDFLGEHTTPFVNELFARVEPLSHVSTKYYIPKPSARTQVPSSALAPVAKDSRSKKRSFQQVNGADQQQAYNGDQKSVRRAGKARRVGGSNGKQPMEPTSLASLTGPFNIPKPPTPPPGLPQLDLNNPLAAYIAFQTMFPHMTGTTGRGQPILLVKKDKCRNYHQKGFCAKGTGCPYSHGEDPVLATPEEYDPNNALIDANGRVLNHRPGLYAQYFGAPQVKRSKLAKLPPRPFKNHNSKAVLVEGIPSENFDDAQISTFFGHYGRVVKVSLKITVNTSQRFRNSAIVAYASHAEAAHAMNSPKAVFHNRFVKVSWSMPAPVPENGVGDVSDNSVGKPSSHRSTTTDDDDMTASCDTPVEAEIDLEAVKAQQAIKQKEHEERRRKLQEVSEQRAEILRKTEEIQKKRDLEKAVLLAKIAETEGSSQATKRNVGGTPTTANELREHLAKLEAEARLRGIDPDAMSIMENSAERITSSSIRGSGSLRGGTGRGLHRLVRGTGTVRGRGGYQGYGNYYNSAPCARQWPSSATGYYYFTRAPAVMKLDNRPKSLLISGKNIFDDVDGNGKLRQALLQIGEFEDVQEQSRGKPGEIINGGVIVTFRERWQAEIVMKKLQAEKTIQGLGAVEVQWMATPVGSSDASTPRTMLEVESDDNDGEEMRDVKVEDVGQHQHQHLHEHGDVNLDVAGDDEWDLIN